MPGFLDDLLSSPIARGFPEAARAAASGDYAAVAGALGRSSIGRVEVRSQVAPPVSVSPFEPSPPEAPPNPILAFVRPEVRVYDPEGQLVVAVAPYGEPAENYFPWLVGGAILLAVGAWVSGAFLLRRILK